MMSMPSLESRGRDSLVDSGISFLALNILTAFTSSSIDDSNVNVIFTENLSFAPLKLDSTVASGGDDQSN